MHSRGKYHWLPHVPLTKNLADNVLKTTYCLFIEFSIILLCKIWHSIGPYPKFSLWLQVQRLKSRISNSDVKFFLSLKWWPFLRMHTYKSHTWWTPDHVASRISQTECLRNILGFSYFNPIRHPCSPMKNSHLLA